MTYHQSNTTGPSELTLDTGPLVEHLSSPLIQDLYQGWVQMLYTWSCIKGELRCVRVAHVLVFYLLFCWLFVCLFSFVFPSIFDGVLWEVCAYILVSSEKSVLIYWCPLRSLHLCTGVLWEVHAYILVFSEKSTLIYWCSLRSPHLCTGKTKEKRQTNSQQNSR
jgi:hypothetical protein